MVFTQTHAGLALATGTAAGVLAYNYYDTARRENVKNKLHALKNAKPYVQPSALKKLASIMTQSRAHLAPAELPTLIIDMDTVLLGKQQQNGQSTMALRPGAQQFVDSLAGEYDVVLYSSFPPAIAENVAKGVDPSGKVVTKSISKHPKLKWGRFWAPKVAGRQFLGTRSTPTLVSTRRGAGALARGPESIVISPWRTGDRDTALYELADDMSTQSKRDPVAPVSGEGPAEAGLQRVLFGGDEPRNPLLARLMGLR